MTSLLDVRLGWYPVSCWSFRAGRDHLIIDFWRFNLYVRLGG